MAISTNGTVLARLAGGLYNTTLSNATYAEVNAVVKTAADINTLANDLYARDFASKTDLSVATTLLSNLGLSSVTGLANWVAAQLTAAGAANKGAKVVSLLNDFANLTSDATYGAAATSFNTKTTAALALSQKDGSAGGDFNVAAAIAAADAAAAAAAAAAKATADAAAAKAAADAAAAKAAADAAAAAAAAKAAADAAAVKAAADAAAAAKAAADAAAVQAAADAAAKAAADAAAAAEKAPQTFTLTTSANTFTGKSGNDSFDGSLNSTGAQTLNTSDVLTGGAGNDTLTASLVNASIVTPTMSSVEAVTVTATNASGTATLSLLNSTGVTSVGVSGSTAAPSITNIDSTATALSVSDQAVGASFAYKAATVAGTADSATVTLSNVTAGDLTVSGIETLNLVSSGAANVLTSLNASSAKTVNVSGSENINLGTLTNTAAVTSINGSTLTGKLTVASAAANTVLTAITGGAGNDTITVDGVAVASTSISGGAGDDTVTFGTTNALASGDTVSGGDGTDTLAINAASAPNSTTTAFTRVTGFENLTITDTLANAATADNLTTAYVQAGIAKVTLAAADTNASTVTMEAGAKTVSLSVALGNSLTVVDTGIATTDSLTITNSSTTALDVGAGKALTSTGFESVTINTTGAGAATTQTYGTVTITSDTGGTGKLYVTGSNSIEIGALATGKLLDGSGLTGTATLKQTAQSSSVTTIVGSASADTLWATSTSTSGTAITAGAGADTITAGAGNDNISGGDGNDRIVTANALTSTDTISGGDGTDTITWSGTSGNADTDFTNVTSVETLTSAAATTAALDKLALAAGVVTYNLFDGGVDTITVGDGYTGTLTVNVTNSTDVDVVSAAASTATIKLGATGTTIGTVGTFTGGTGSGDTLTYTITSGSAVSQTLPAGLTAFETINTAGATDTNVTLTLADANIAATKSLTVDASSLVTGKLNLTATAEADGKLIVIGGQAADTITGSGSTYGDNLTGGVGSDVFVFADGKLTTDDTISGGTGTNVIRAVGTVADSAFTNTTLVQTFTANGAATTVTFGAAAAAGLVTVNDYSSTSSYLEIFNIGSTTNVFTNDISVSIEADTVSGTDGDDVIAASTYTNALTVTTGTALTTNNVVTGGAGTSDTLRFNSTTNGAITQTSGLNNVTKIEKFLAYGDSTANLSITTHDNNAAADKTLTIDGSALTTGTLAADVTADTDGYNVVIGGGAADTITGSASTYGDSLTGGAGDDTFSFASANLTMQDTIAGGTGNDVLTFSDAATVVDSDFTSVTSVEYVTNSGSHTMNVTLGAAAQSAGVTRVTLTGATNDVVTVGSGFTGNLRVTVGTGDDTVTATSYTGNLDVRAAAASITAADTITGGTGTADVLTLTADNNATGATLTNVSKFETLNVVKSATAGHDIVISMPGTGTIAAGKTLTVNATALTAADETLTFLGTNSETNGYLSITGGNGADSIVGGGAADTISGGEGADTITGGTGVDIMTGGAGNDTFVYVGAGAYETGIISPSIVYYGGLIASGTSVSTAGMDKITDFSTGDVLKTYAASGTTGTGANTIDAIWTETAGLIQGTYTAATNTFVFSATGTDSLYVWDYDGLTTTGTDMYSVVLIGYVDTTANDTMTSGLTGVAA